MRSSYLYQGQILLVVSHNKTLRIGGQLYKRIPRLLPLALSQLLVDYLVLVRPLEIRLVEHVYAAGAGCIEVCGVHVAWRDMDRAVGSCAASISKEFTNAAAAARNIGARLATFV